MAKKYFYTDYVPEGYEEIGGKLRKPLKNFLGYITRYTRHDATYTSVGYKPLSLDRFASELKMSKSTAQEFIALLEAKGYVEVERGGTYDKENNRYNANRFRLANRYAALAGLNKTQDMAQPEQQPTPVEDNIDWKGKYDALYEKAGAEWRKKNKECKELQARLDKANQWKKNLGTYEFIESAVAFYRNHKDSNGQPDEEKNALQAEIEKLTAENEKLRKSIDSSLQEDTPQEQHDAELQKYKNSLEEAVEDNKRLTAENAELKVKLDDKHLNDEKNRRIAELTNQTEEKDKEINRLRAENAQQKRTHERQIEELTDDIRGKEAEIKNLKSDLKKAKAQASSLVVEPSTPYGGNVKTIYCN